MSSLAHEYFRKRFESASLQNKVLIHAKSMTTKHYLTSLYCLYLLFQALQGKLNFLFFHIQFILLVRGDRAIAEYTQRERESTSPILYATHYYNKPVMV